MIVVIVSLAIGFTNPFTAVQLLWIDIIMDGPPALTLAMENDKGQFMTEKPVKRTDGILNFPMLLRIITQGIFMAIVVLLQYGYDFIGVGREAIPTSVFCLFVIFQLFNAFNCRKIGSESIFKGIGDNKLMLAVFFATFVFQIIITQYLCGFFSTVKLSVVSWVKIISIGFLSVVFSEIAKVLYKIFKNSKISLIKKRKS
jgi:Ca2+-transporting ATPase